MVDSHPLVTANTVRAVQIATEQTRVLGLVNTGGGASVGLGEIIGDGGCAVARAASAENDAVQLGRRAWNRLRNNNITGNAASVVPRDEGVTARIRGEAGVARISDTDGRVLDGCVLDGVVQERLANDNLTVLHTDTTISNTISGLRVAEFTNLISTREGQSVDGETDVSQELTVSNGLHTSNVVTSLVENGLGGLVLARGNLLLELDDVGDGLTGQVGKLTSEVQGQVVELLISDTSSVDCGSGGQLMLQENGGLIAVGHDGLLILRSQLSSGPLGDSDRVGRSRVERGGLSLRRQVPVVEAILLTETLVGSGVTVAHQIAHGSPGIGS